MEKYLDKDCISIVNSFLVDIDSNEYEEILTDMENSYQFHIVEEIIDFFDDTYNIGKYDDTDEFCCFRHIFLELYENYGYSEKSFIFLLNNIENEYPCLNIESFFNYVKNLDYELNWSD